MIPTPLDVSRHFCTKKPRQFCRGFVGAEGFEPPTLPRVTRDALNQQLAFQFGLCSSIS